MSGLLVQIIQGIANHGLGRYIGKHTQAIKLSATCRESATSMFHDSRARA